jgi:hypothetical protein
LNYASIFYRDASALKKSPQKPLRGRAMGDFGVPGIAL